VEATSYAEILELRQPDTEALAHHASGWFEGSVAVTRARRGAGAVVHCGVALNDAVLAWLWREHIRATGGSGAPAITTSHPAAEVPTRRNHTTALHFVLNHGAQAVTIEPQRPMRDLFDETGMPPRFELPAHAYRVLREAL
jgi:hypothetical protein